MNNKTIRIGSNKDPYEVPLNLFQLAAYLEYIPLDSKREMKEIIAMLELDPRSRRSHSNTIEFKTDENERKSLMSINKGLTMEIFASGMFGHIDHPTEVLSNCLVSHGKMAGEADTTAMPNNFAQGGLPDVQVDYGDYQVILEVSAKHRPLISHFKSQLKGALKHARSIRKNGYGKPIYCILINERSLNLIENIYALEEILKQIKASEDIHLAVMSIQELAELGIAMARDYQEYTKAIDRSTLHEILKETASKQAHGRFHEALLEYLESLKPSSSLQPVFF